MKLKLIEIKEEFSDVKTFIFEPENGATWIPGQFYHYVLHHRPTDERGSDRWFTIASAPHEKLVKITTRFNEKSSTFKRELEKLKPGQSIEVSELEGDFILENPNKASVFIAGGVGVTPFYSIIKDLLHKKLPLNITLLYANRDKNIVFKEEFDEISENNPGFKVHYLISPERVTKEKIKELVSNIEEKIFFISGPEPMVDSLGGMLKEIGIKESQIKQDWFPGYPEE